METLHYDLDQMERDIRAMFADTGNHGRADGKPLDAINQWQDKTCDLLVAFMRWQLEMEMAGVDTETHLKICGIVLADLAQQVWTSFEGDNAKTAGLNIIIRGFLAHSGQVMQREFGGVPPDMSAQINVVTSGRA